MNLQVNIVLPEHITQEIQRFRIVLHDFRESFTDHDNQHFSFNVNELIHRNIKIHCWSPKPLDRIRCRRFAL